MTAIKPFGIISDTHLHNWATFSHINADTGINNRLQWILDEIWRAAEKVKELGGDTLIHTGDVFHVRGNLAPSVLNPTVELFERIVNELELNAYILAGNHDLEGKESNRLGNAAVALEGAGCTVISGTFVDSHAKRVFLPYVNGMKELRQILSDVAEGDKSGWTLYLHAPMNNVIKGIPDNGLSPVELEELGFDAVFCGHYHSHRVFSGNVCSVGSITHQTFSDVGTKSGFIIYQDNTIEHYPTSAPRFVDYDTDWGEEEEIEYVEGNYVRVRLENASNEDVEEIRKYLKSRGAAHTQVIHVPKSEATRDDESTIDAGASMKVSIVDWCSKQGYDEQVIAESQSIIDEVDAA
ncbi:phage exonuclease [Vibrio maritimus]|uniref:Phage exonuclease n=1 Tax=Vibrio maritimus TaxID=990268 RepID=A0A090S5Q5_9VIBR|nr:phage exonuclease [Vibrio maritimus]